MRFLCKAYILKKHILCYLLNDWRHHVCLLSMHTRHQYVPVMYFHFVSFYKKAFYGSTDWLLSAPKVSVTWISRSPRFWGPQKPNKQTNNVSAFFGTVERWGELILNSEFQFRVPGNFHEAWLMNLSLSWSQKSTKSFKDFFNPRNGFWGFYG